MENRRLPRTVTWTLDEPVRGEYPPVEILGLSGLERVAARKRGAFFRPPMHHLTGLVPVDDGLGWSVFALPASPWFRTAVGVFPAGICALVADAPLGAAILTHLPPGGYGVTSELSMSFLRPAGVESGRLVARASAIEVGRSLGLSECIVEDAHGRKLAHGTSRYFLQHLSKPPEPHVLEIIPPPKYDTPDPHVRAAPDPEPPERWRHLSGLEHLRALGRGVLALTPFQQLFGLRPESAEDGAVRLSAPASPWLTSPARTIYGGILALYADAAMTAATATTLAAAQSCATLDLTVHFLRPGIADGTTLVLEGGVVHRGRSLAVTRAEIRNAAGKALVLASGSSLIVDRPWQAVAVADEPEPPAEESDAMPDS